MARGVSGGVQGLSAQTLDIESQEELWSLGLAMVAPVRAHGALAGFLAVGRKRSGTAYQSEELAFLSAVAAQVAIALERATAEGAQFGRYRIERRLGVGGVAEVFLAWQLGPGGFERKVALKRPLPDLAEDPECAAMFLDEARIAAQLHHRNIVQVYEIDQQDGVYFIAMEYVDGPSLRSLIKTAAARGQRVPVRVGASIARAVLRALGHAHQLTDAHGQSVGLVHRDVTPSNILLTAAGEVKLVDFGIARAADRMYRTRTGMARGTVPYMSPEQAQGSPVDARSDLYSAGAVFYELFTSHRAFPEGPTTSAPLGVSRLEPSLPAALDSVLARALSFDRKHRHANAEAFWGELVEVLSPPGPADEEEVAAWVRELAATPSPGLEPTARVQAPIHGGDK